MPGLLAEYEEREAALFGHYNWDQWSALPREQRLHGVAHFRLHNLIDAHLHAIGDARSRQAARARQ